MRDICWNYEWWVFKIGWEQKTVHEAEIESSSSFVFQYSKVDEVHVFFFKTLIALEKKNVGLGLHLGLELHCCFQLRIKTKHMQENC